MAARSRRFLGVLAVCLMASSLASLPASADTSAMVINELMYHPADPETEFIELYNSSNAPIDISDWCFTEGVDGCFGAGTPPVPAGGYVTVTKDLTGYANDYPGAPTPLFQYEGKLSNGGEPVTLTDSAGQVADTVSYLDAAPWPTTPDGLGPSLELIDAAGSNQAASAWAASLDASGSTPGAENSLTGGGNPTIANVLADPAWPAANTEVTVSAELTDPVSANLVYRVGFGSETTLAMNDGPNSVGGAGDGTWSATVPGQAVGELIRYKIVLGGPNAVQSPAASDSINYHGVTVRHGVSSALPVVELFIPDDVIDDLMENHRFDDVTGEVAVAVDGVVYDNATMRIRGASSRANEKPSWKVKLPSGYLITRPDLLSYPIDQFNLQSDRFPLTEMGWDTASAEGEVHPDYFKALFQRNGSYWYTGSFSTSYDGEFRDHYGYDDWAIYKAVKNRGRTRESAAVLEAKGDWEKKERKDEDYTDLWNLTQALDAPASQAQADWIWENMDVPRMINYAAVVGLMRHSDSSWRNYYIARDSAGTQRWEMWMWDIDQLFSNDQEDDDGDFLTPAYNGQKFMIALMNHAEFRQMYFRRLRTFQDSYLEDSYFLDLYNSIGNPYLAEAEQDRQLWGGRTWDSKRNRLTRGLTDRREIFARNQGADGSDLIPPSASGQTPVVINEVHYDPLPGGDFEYVELYNTSTTESIDLSNWTLSDGVNLTITPGTVILPGGYLLLVDTDTAYRSEYDPTTFVAGEYSGGLKNSGETLTLRTSMGATVDSLTWSNVAPWPEAAGGSGPSLSRISPAGNTNDPANWSPSAQVGGTPGIDNDGTPPPVDDAVCFYVRDGGSVEVTFADFDWLSLVVRRSVNNSRYYWRARFDGQADGTFTDSDRVGASMSYQVHPGFGIAGTPVDCTEGDPPPPVDVPACSYVRGGGSVVVTFADIEWSSLVVRRSVNNSQYYWRARVDGQADGTFTDTDRPGVSMAYHVGPAFGIAGTAINCTAG